MIICLLFIVNCLKHMIICYLLVGLCHKDVGIHTHTSHTLGHEDIHTCVEIIILH